MTGTVLQFRDEGDRPTSLVALASGEQVQLALDAGGLVITQIGPPGPSSEALFRAGASIVASICAGLVGPKRTSTASPLRILTALVQGIGSAAEVRAAFEDAAGLD